MVNIYDEEELEQYAKDNSLPFHYGYSVFVGNEAIDIGWRWQLLNIHEQGITFIGVNLEEGTVKDENIVITMEEIDHIEYKEKLLSIELTIQTKNTLLETVTSVSLLGKETIEEVKNPKIIVTIRKIFSVDWHKENAKNILEHLKGAEKSGQ